MGSNARTCCAGVTLEGIHMLNKPLIPGRIAICSFATAFFLNVLTGPIATSAVGSTNDADCKVKIHGKGYIIDEGTNKSRSTFKFKKKKKANLGVISGDKNLKPRIK